MNAGDASVANAILVARTCIQLRALCVEDQFFLLCALRKAERIAMCDLSHSQALFVGAAVASTWLTLKLSSEVEGHTFRNGSEPLKVCKALAPLRTRAVCGLKELRCWKDVASLVGAASLNTHGDAMFVELDRAGLLVQARHSPADRALLLGIASARIFNGAALQVWAALTTPDYADRFCAVARLASGGWHVRDACVKPTPELSDVHQAARLELVGVLVALIGGCPLACYQQLVFQAEPTLVIRGRTHELELQKALTPHAAEACLMVRGVCAVGGLPLLSAILDGLGISTDHDGVRAAVAEWAHAAHSACASTILHCAPWWSALRYHRVASNEDMFLEVEAARAGRPPPRPPTSN